MWEFWGTFFWINYEALQIIKLVEYQTSPSQPHVSHLIVSFPSTYIPSLYISLSIPINNKLLRKLSMLMSHTLTDTQAVQHCTLQLLQQAVFPQHRRLGLLDSKRGTEYVGKNRHSSITVGVWRYEIGKAAQIHWLLSEPIREVDQSASRCGQFTAGALGLELHGGSSVGLHYLQKK